MKKNVLLLIGIAVLLFLGVLVLRPVPILPEDELTVTEGTVALIFEGGSKDIMFKLQENPDYFYINRGLEQGLTINSLKALLIGREVVIKYPEYWSLIGNDDVHHLSKLEFEGETIFSELD